MDKYYLACSKLVKLTKISNLTVGSVFCPFHTNINTKSAHLYADADGVERIYCYVCKRQYTSGDYLNLILDIKDIKKYLLERFSLEEIEKAYQEVLVKTKEEKEIPEFTTSEEFFKSIYLGEYYDRIRKN